MPDPFSRAELLALAGDCTKCANYDLDSAEFTAECSMCKRYHGDLFEPREDVNDASGSR